MKEKAKVIAGVVGVIILAAVWNYESRKPNENTSKSTTTQSQTSTERQTAVRLEGSGDRIKTVSLKRGLAIFTITYYGSRHFAVWLKDSGGEELELLANETEAYSGQKSVKIQREGTYLLEITAGGNGKWKIDIE